MRSEPLIHDPEERLFTWDDIAKAFFRSRKTLAKVSLVTALIVFSQLLLTPPYFAIEATFKEGAEKTGEGAGLKELLSGFGGGISQPQAIALMKSSQVLRPLAERFGLQASVQRQGRLAKILSCIRNNLKAERGAPLPEVDDFSFEHVRYGGEKECSFRLQFLDREHFDVFDVAGNFLTTGEVGTPVKIGEVAFTCSQVPQRLFFKKPYVLSIAPWLGAAQEVKRNFKIVSTKTNHSIYDLTFSWPSRFQGTQILNGLMEEYQKYLKREYNQLVSEQMNYLEQEQAKIYARLEGVFEDHASYLKEGLKEKGFVGLKEEIAGYLGPHDRMRSRSLEIDLEIAALEKKNLSFTGIASGSFVSSLTHTFNEIQSLEQQRDFLELAVQKHSTEPGMEKYFTELSSIRSQKQETEQLLQSLQAGNTAFSSSFAWAKEFPTAQQTDLSDYLSNHLRLLSVREKILQERVTHPGTTSVELDGIDLKISQQLFKEYVHKLDLTEALLRQYSQLREQLSQQGFEVGSLAVVLKDPISQKIIESVNSLSLKLKDEKHRSSKEGERWKEEIVFYHKVLEDHLTQLWKAEDLNAHLIRERIAALQSAGLDSIHQQLSVLEERLDESIEDHKKNLAEEKKLLELKMIELRNLALEFPDRWKLENWLNLKTGMATKVMTGLTELVESKTIGQHLHHVESKPLDPAIVPLLAKKPHLYLKAAMGGIFAAVALFLFLIARAILKGFPTFSNKLVSMRYPYSGVISAICDGPEVELLSGPDLETLRRLALFLESGSSEKTVGLVGGKGPDYSYALAQNLARMGKQVLLVRCDFNAKFQDSDRPGLLQWLQEKVEEIPLRRANGFDFISAGGFSPFGMESLQSHRFKTLVDQAKTSYDFVLMWLPAPLDLAEAKALLSHSEKAIVTVAGEQPEQLTPFMDWTYDKNRLTFIAFE
ncbi:MAG: hypothetical protein KGJ02_01705 [Verrucomicrobiota bacterium]|nr:hypothetical protein [Verrucomicrobiota bacterium]